MKHLLLRPGRPGLPALPALISVIALSACSQTGANYTPIVDGAQGFNFQQDLAACQNLARSQKQFDQNAWGATAVGAGTGALLGGVDDDVTALEGALVGAIAGGAAGAVEASEKRQSIIVECLKGRGHSVVG